MRKLRIEIINSKIRELRNSLSFIEEFLPDDEKQLEDREIETGFIRKLNMQFNWQ